MRTVVRITAPTTVMKTVSDECTEAIPPAIPDEIRVSMTTGVSWGTDTVPGCELEREVNAITIQVPNRMMPMPLERNTVSTPLNTSVA